MPFIPRKQRAPMQRRRRGQQPLEVARSPDFRQKTVSAFHLNREAMMKTNTQLQVDVMEELQYEPIIDAACIGITARDGIVTLTGIVRSLAEKWAAAHAAERIGGVKAVVDQMTVELPEMHLRNDEDIARAVVNVLNWDVMVP